MIKIVALGFIVIVLIILCLIYICRIIHKKQACIKSTNGIQETVFININDIKQELNIRGENRNNPVILFLHGGPGNPTGCFDYIWQPYLNKHFTIVTYAQRGCGRTYYDNSNAEVSRKLIIQDIDKIIDYLKERFEQDKIIILGHSWGTLIGTIYVYEHPENVMCYIGVGQMVNALNSEKIAFDEAIKRATKANDNAYIKKITKYYDSFCSSYKVSYDYLSYRNMESKYLMGDKEKTSAFIYYDIFTSPNLNLKDIKWSIFDNIKILMDDNNPLTEELFTFNAYQMSDFKVPMCFISGSNDYITPFSEVQSYFEYITAPEKKIININGAGHITFIDLPEEFSNAIYSFIYGSHIMYSTFHLSTDM